uniref:Uncharacterized protein n=1 Tax=Cyprinus carpio TaxID=7962 RepID=A0A8C2J520_CYPCA
MDELLEKFLEDQKTKLAEEKACLEQEPPYMEMRVRERVNDGDKENVWQISPAHFFRRSL